MIDFTPAQAAPRIASLLTARESRTLDFKRVSGKMVGKALEAICAFANTKAGFAHILATFPLVAEPVKVAALNAYRDVERGLVK